MTAFFTRCCTKLLKARAALLIGIVGLVCCLGLAGLAHAEIDLKNALVEPHEDAYAISAEFDLTLSPRLKEALVKGVPLYFITEAELIRPRWYWTNEKTGVVQQTRRIAYNALTRQFQVGSGSVNSLQQSVATVEEALGLVARVKQLKIAERTDVLPAQAYQVWVRLRLDTTQLPKPFQVNAITNKDWTLNSDWKRFNFTAPPEWPAK